MALTRYKRTFYKYNATLNAIVQTTDYSSTFGNGAYHAVNAPSYGEVTTGRFDANTDMKRFNPPEVAIGNKFPAKYKINMTVWTEYLQNLRSHLSSGPSSGTYNLHDHITNPKKLIDICISNNFTYVFFPTFYFSISGSRYNQTLQTYEIAGACYLSNGLGQFNESTGKFYSVSNNRVGYGITFSNVPVPQIMTRLSEYYSYNIQDAEFSYSASATGFPNVTRMDTGNVTNIFAFLRPKVPGFPLNELVVQRINAWSMGGSWTTDGTIDPTDPGETPTPPVPPGPIDPPDPPDLPDPDDPITPPELPGIGGVGTGLFTVYNPSDITVRLLAAKLWDDTIWGQIKLNFANPMETIMGFGIIPVQPSTSGSREIMFGMVGSGVSAPVVNSDYKIVDCGSRVLHTYYGSYLDFEPYTKLSMYLPYIGEVEMNPDEMVGKTIGVKYYVNVITGDIVAMVTADGTIIYTAAANCFRQLPLSQADMAQVIQTAVSAVAAIAGAAVGGAASAGGAPLGATFSPGAQAAGYASSGEVAVAAGKEAASAAPNLNTVMSTKMHYHRTGRLGTGSGQLSYQTPYMIVLRPNLMLPDGAGDVGTNSDLKAYKGYPCNQIVQLSSLHGLTVVEAARLAISGAAVEEIDEILTLLKGGAIL